MWEEARLGIADLTHRWILMLDNADDPHLYRPYIPSSPLGLMVVTSRSEECHQHATTATRLRGLSAGAAWDLLLKAEVAHVPVNQHSAQEGDTAQMAVLLLSHPLALVQTGTYIPCEQCRLDRYSAINERQRRRLFTVSSRASSVTRLGCVRHLSGVGGCSQALDDTRGQRCTYGVATVGGVRRSISSSWRCSERDETVLEPCRPTRPVMLTTTRSRC